jgi:MoxR-like ATPase
MSEEMAIPENEVIIPQGNVKAGSLAAHTAGGEAPLADITVQEFLDTAQAIVAQLERMIVGQRELVHNLLVTLLAGGNALLEGVPGLGKTILIRSLAQVLDSSFNRIQFTPDLMPADITGTMIISETPDGRRGFRFERGPIFSNLLLADEINRASPRTQSALLEAMQERHVTVAGTSHPLPQPFFVLATQNPLEMEGTYPLPEAQLDRFLYKIDVSFPGEEDLMEIARRTTGATLPQLETVASSDTLRAMQHLARQVPVADNVLRYAARLVQASHTGDPRSPESVRRHVRVGASPRGIQALIWAGKVEALLENRKAVAIDDVRKVTYPALRHRLLLTYEAQAEGIPPDELIDDILSAVPVPKS